jgi:hypothetical protein
MALQYVAQQIPGKQQKIKKINLPVDDETTIGKLIK